jgi:glycosyltransferase involved in cell wall biosynthesis
MGFFSRAIYDRPGIVWSFRQLSGGEPWQSSSRANQIILMNHVLLIAYHYPPSQAVGGIRPSKFARYLPVYGWQPTVLTLRNGVSPDAADASAVTPVVRAREWPHPLKAYERWQEHRAERRGRREEYLARITPTFEQRVTPARKGLGLKRWISTFLWLPDREIGWMIPATLQALRLIRQRHITHLITTGPPFTCHLVGLLLKRATGVAWIADFRDPWSLKHRFPAFRNGVTDAIETALIRTVMTRADRVICVTDSMTDEARKDWAGLDPGKFVTLPSGFDVLDFQQLSWSRPRPDPPQPVIFSYVGTFYHGRTPEPFLRAVQSLIQDGSLARTDVAIRFVGQVERAEGLAVSALVARYGLEAQVTLRASVPRQEALRELLEAHVSLVLDERHPIQIPFKLYDALASGAIILNIGARGAVADVLAKTGRGVVVDHTSQAEIRKGILECVHRSRDEHRPAGAPWEEPGLQAYNFSSLTARLAGVLAETAPSTHG